MNEKQRIATQQVATNERQTQMSGSIGVIMSYDNMTNTATVAITQNESDEIREILNNVPCPVTMGVQTVSPTPGMLCWLQFRNGNITSPLVVHFYNHRFDQFGYEKQYKTTFTLPMSLMD